MKEISMFPYLLFSMIYALGAMTSVVSAQLPGTLSNGLVSYYSFDGNANDSAGTNNATAVGVVLTNGVSGVPNTAYSFSGPLSYLTAPLNPPTNNSFSWSVWIKPSVIKETYYFMAGEINLNEGSKSFFMAPNGLVGFGSYDGNLSEEDNRVNGVINSAPIKPNEWTHIAITSDTNNLRTLFVNGVFVTNKVSSGYGQLGVTNFIFGADRFLRDELSLHGSMDDVAIYDRPLSTTEVGQLYQQLANNLDSDGDGLTDAWERGFGRYQVIEGSFTWEQANQDAQIRGGHVATFTSDAEWQSFVQNFGDSMTHPTRIGMETSNTSPSGYRWVTDEKSMFFNWAPEQPNGSFETTVVVYGQTANREWHDFSTSNPFPYVLELGYPTDPFNADTDGDGFNDKVESDEHSDPNDASTTPALTDHDQDGVNYFRETADGTNPNNPNSFNPLSKGLVVYYPFRGNFDDASGNGNNLTNVDSSSVLSAGRFGETSGSLKLGNTIESVQPLGISGNQFFSFSMWVKTAAVDISTINVGFFGMGPSANAGDSVGLGAFPNYSSSLYVYGNNADLFAPTMNNNAFHQWSSVTYVYAGSIPNSKLYLNGVALDFTNHPRSTDIRNMVSSKIEFGSGGLPFDTFISDFRMYNRALSESEVRQLFYTEAFSDAQKQFVTANPFVAGLYSASEYNANRTNGRIDVLTNPSAFNLFRQSDYESFGALQFSNGVSSVITNPSGFNLFTQEQFNSNRIAGQSDVIGNPISYGLYTSNSIMDLRMGGLMLQKIGTNAVISFQPQTTTDLNLPFTNNGTPITNTIPMPGNKGFIRINAKP